MSTPRDKRVIAFMNQKGGVGKTTTTVNLGAAIAQTGANVLLIDLDPQAHLTLHVGVDPSSLGSSIYDLLLDDQASPFETVRRVDKRLALLPAEVDLAAAEQELARLDDRNRRLGPRIGPLLEAFDYVLVDCPPSLGLLTLNALSIAGEVIVPMQAHFLALQGLSKLLETVQLVRQNLNPNLRVSGVVLAMHEAHTNLATEVVADLQQFFDQARGQDLPWSAAQIFQPPIRRNIKLAECPSFGQTIFQYAPKCPGAEDYLRLARSVLKQGSGVRDQVTGSTGGDAEPAAQSTEPSNPASVVESDTPVETNETQLVD